MSSPKAGTCNSLRFQTAICATVASAVQSLVTARAAWNLSLPRPCSRRGGRHLELSVQPPVGAPVSGTRTAASPGTTSARLPLWRVAAGLAQALLLASALAPLPAMAQSETEVPNAWPLKPSGLEAGDRFRLLFATSGTSNAQSTDIADYNTFVQGAARTGHVSIRAYANGFRVVGSTGSVDARDNTSTTGTGVPIHWLGGGKVADNYADFYDGTWDDETSAKDEAGNPRSLTSTEYPFTGTKINGTAEGQYPLGGASSLRIVLLGQPGDNSTATPGPLHSASTDVNGGVDYDQTRPFYALSQVFLVADNQAATGKPSISGTAKEVYELTANLGTIADDDGLPSLLKFQWVRVDADGTSNEMNITGSTAHTYKLTSSDVGKRVKVKVSFTDGNEFDEGPLVSDAYPAVGTIEAASDDATLSGLTLSGVTLGESFASDKKSYTATAPYTEAQTTVSATTNEPNAMVIYQDGSGDEIRDADVGSTGHQIDLAEGENVIKVVVTSENERATDTYTVTVARSGPQVDLDPSKTVTEGSMAEFVVRLSGPSTADVTLDYMTAVLATDTATLRADAPGGADFTTTSGTLTIVAGDNEGTIRVPTGDDNTDEHNETFSLDISNPSPDRVPLGRTRATATIEDNDATPIFLGADRRDVSEGSSTLDVNLEINPSGKTVSMDYATANGTAVAGEDYVSGSGTLTFAPGDVSKTVRITLHDDGLAEADETFVLVLSNPSNIQLPTGQDRYRVTILDNEAVPSATLMLSPASIDEDGGLSTVTATLMPPSSERTTITVSVSPIRPAVPFDYNLSSNRVLTIPAGSGSSTGTVTIRAVDNDTSRGDKMVTVQGDAENVNGASAPSEVSLTITDDELVPTSVTLTLDKSEIREQETSASARRVAVTATLPAALPDDTVVTIRVAATTAMAGDDFTPIDDFTITIPADQISATGLFQLAPINDNIHEGDETLTLTGSTDASGLSVEPAAGLELVITDNDQAPRVTLALAPIQISENRGTSTLTAKLSNPSGAETTITVSAGQAARRALSSTTLTIPAGELVSSGSITITGHDNDAAGAAETRVTVSGSAENELGVSTVESVSLTILDDETAAGAVLLSLSPSTVSEGAGSGGEEVTVTATLPGGAPDSDTTVTIIFLANTAKVSTDYSALQGFDMTIPADSTSGTGTFTLRPIDDAVREPDETLSVGGKIAGGRNRWVVLTIQDDDEPPKPTLHLEPDSISENGGTSTVTATLDHPSSVGTRIVVSALPIGAVTTSDFQQSGTVLNISAGQTSSTGTVTITAVDNDYYRAVSEVRVSGTASNSLGTGQPDSQTLTLDENDTQSETVTLSAMPTAVPEGATGSTQEVTVTATLDAGTRTVATQVGISVDGDTATTGTDFLRVNPFRLTIPAGERSGSATFELAPLIDGLDEPDETVTLSGSVSDGLRLEPSGGLKLNIRDTDEPPQVTLIPGSALIGEDGGSTTITAMSNRPSSVATTVTVVASAGGEADSADFMLTGSTLTIPAHGMMSTGTVTLVAVDNDTYQTGKSVQVGATISNSVGHQTVKAVVVSISEDDTASQTVTLSLGTDTVSETATGSDRVVSVIATLDSAARPDNTQVTISVRAGTATPGDDFSAVSDFTLEIPANSKSGADGFVLVPVADDIDEPTETLTVTGSTTSSGLRILPTDGRTLRISDANPPPTVTLVLQPDSITENDETTTVTATLDYPSTEVTTVTVFANPAAPAVEGDFNLSSNQLLTIPAGAVSSTGTVTITTVDNPILQSGKAVTVSADARNTLGVTSPDDVELMITDDETASTSISLSVKPQLVNEARAQRVEVTATLDGAPETADREVTVSVMAPEDPVPEGFAPFYDFRAVPDFTINIPALQKSGSAIFTFTPVTDETHEPDLWVPVNGNAPGLLVNGTTLTIQDDETVPKVSLVLTPASVREDGRVSTVTAELDNASFYDTTITITAEAVSPAIAGDFELSGSRTLTIPAEQFSSTRTARITTVDNAIFEANKSVTVRGEAVNTLAIVQPDPETLTILEDETRSTAVNLTLDVDEVLEDDGSTDLTITAQLDHAAGVEPVEVTVAVSGGTAVAGADYAEISEFTVTIPARETEGTATFSLSPVSDETDEPNRTIILSGSAPGLTVEPTGGLTVSLQDDDDAPVVTLALGSVDISEAAGSTVVTASLDRPSSEATEITVSFSPTGHAEAGDFSVTGGTTLTIPAGTTVSTGTVTVTAVQNDIADEAKVVEVRGIATNTVGITQPDPVQLGITEDDRKSMTLTLSLRGVNSAREDAGATEVDVTGSLDAAASPDDIAITISVSGGTAVAGADFAEFVGETFTLTAGNTELTAKISLTALPDDIDEAPETLTISATTNPNLTVDGVLFTIEDNDPAPTPTLILTPDTIPEGGRSTVTARLDGKSSATTTIMLVATAVPPAVSADFDLSGTELTIPPGETDSVGSITITSTQNNLTNDDKRVTVGGSATNDVGKEQPAAVFLDITDDDTPSTTVNLTVSPISVSESAGSSGETVTVTATLDGSPRAVGQGNNIDIQLRVEGGSADVGTDFSAVSDFSLTITGGQKSGSASFQLQPVDDDIDEPAETIRVVAPSTASGLDVAPSAALEVEIEDNDDTPQVTLTSASTTITEVGGTTEVTAELDHPSSEATEIVISSTPTNPATNSDFTQTGTVLTIPAGSTTSTGSVSLTAVDNTTFSVDKTVTVSGVATNDQGIDQPDTISITITEDDTESSTITLTAAPDEVDEDETATVTVTADLNEAARSEATLVTVTVSEGTADEGTDYAAVSDFNITIPANSKTGRGSFRFSTLDDDASEADETVLLEGSTTTSGLTVAPPGGVELTIADDEPAPRVTLTVFPPSISEGGVSTVTAELDFPSGDRTSVEVAVAPVAPATTGDFTLSSNTSLSIAAGTTRSTGTVTITSVENLVSSAAKQLTVSGTSTNAIRVQGPEDKSLTITDNDTPSTTVTLTVSTREVQEGSDGRVEVTAALDGAARQADTEIEITVVGGTATEGDDFVSPGSFTVTIPSNQGSGTATLSLQPVDDNIDERNETVLLRAPSQVSGLDVILPFDEITIIDQDSTPQVTLELTPPNINENGGTSQLKATLDHPSSDPTTVSVPAPTGLAEDAYRLRGSSLTIPAGATESTGSLTVTALDNDVDDGGDRDYSLTGSATNELGVDQPVAVMLTIEDDDIPSTEVALSISVDAIPEGASRSVTVTATLNGTALSGNTDITISVANTGTAIRGTDFEEISDFTLQIPGGQRSAGTSFTLVALANDVDEPDKTVVLDGTLQAGNLTVVWPSGSTITIEDDDTRGVRIAPLVLAIVEGGNHEYKVNLESEPTGDVTIRPTATTSGARTVTINPQTLTFTKSDWNAAQSVTISVGDDVDPKADAQTATISHTISGADYGSVVAEDVEVTVPGLSVDGSDVKFRVPDTGQTVVTVPEGTPVPGGVRVELPSSLAGALLTLRVVPSTDDTPPGFRAGDEIVDITLEDNSTLAGETATVCLPVQGNRGRVYHRDDAATPAVWVLLDEPAGGSPAGLACGVTDGFSLFAVGTAPSSLVAKVWLAKFGQTLAQHVADAVQDRVGTPRAGGIRGKLAGQDLPAEGSVRPGSMMAGHPQGGREWLSFRGTAIGSGDDWAGPGFRSHGLTKEEFLAGSQLALTGSNDDGVSVAVWGRGAVTDFEGGDGDASLDGKVSTAMAGADWASDRLLAGVAVSLNKGRGSWKRDDDTDKVEATMTGLHPYFGYRVSDRVSIWGVAGLGRGDMDVPDGSEEIRTDIDMSMASGGVRGDLGTRLVGTDVALAMKADGLFVRINADKAEGLEAIAADATRLRFALEGSMPLDLAQGRTLTPALEVGVRRDDGDAETGFGADVSVGISWSDPAGGLSAEARGRGLLTHEDSDFRERSFSGSLTWDPQPSSDLGLTISASQTVGGPATAGADAFLSRQTIASTTADDGTGSSGNHRFEARIGYGLPMFGHRYTIVPEVGFDVSDSSRLYRLGWKIGLARPDTSDFSLGVEGTRRETPGEDEGVERGIGLRLSVRW